MAAASLLKIITPKFNPMAYITKAQVEQYMGVTISSTINDYITTLIAFATKYIESYTGRKFEAPSPDTAITRYYDGNDCTRLSIDDLRELTSLTVDGVALTVNEDFYLYPLNAQSEAADLKPYEWIELIQPETRLNVNSRVQASSPYVFECGQRRVVLVGKFGYSATAPADVQVAALKLVAGVIKENIGDADVKEISSESVGEYSVTFEKVSQVAGSVKANELLNQFKRIPLNQRMAAKSGGIVQIS